MLALRRAAAWLRSYRGAALAAFLVWAAIVAIGAQARPSTTRWVAIPSLGDVLLAMLGIWCIGVLAFYIWIATAPTGESDDEDRRPPASRSSLRWLVLLAIFFMVLVWVVPRGTPPGAGQSPERAVAPDLSTLTPEATANGESEAAALTGAQLVGLVALVLCAVAAVEWNRRRLRAASPTGPVDDVEESAIDSLVARVTDRLRLGDDPRSAVLLAYAELERGLAENGHPRRASETPAEHTRRVMRFQPIDGSALVELAHLYERARFSEHDVTVADQQTATLALERLRSALEVRP